MAKTCCTECLPALLSSQLEQQRLEIALQKQQAEIIRLRFGLELRDLTASFSAPAWQEKPDPETLSREMIRKYEAYSRSLKRNRQRNTSLRRSWESSTPESEIRPRSSLTLVSKQVQTASLPSSSGSSRRTASVSASPPYPVFSHFSASPEHLPLRSSSKLMSILRESELGPSLKTSQPPIARLVNRSSLSFDMEESSRSQRTHRPLHQITLEELMNSEEKEGFLPIFERDNRLFSEDGSEVTVTSVFGGTLSSGLKVYRDMDSALGASGAAVRLTFGDPRLRSSSIGRAFRPVEVLRRSQDGLSHFALD